MPKFPLIFAGSLVFALPALAQEKVTYADHVRPLLENKCFSCHNPDKKKGDLDLTSFAAAMAGSGNGSIISAGDPDGSKMIGSITKKSEPYMPPEGAPLSAKEIEVIARWIEGGVLETKSSLAKKSVPRANIALVSAPKGKPQGPPPMPEHVLLEPVVVAPRGSAVTALAASPWAPLVAIAGMKQALIYDADTKALAGIYPYPEGFIRSLKFSQNGAFLIAGGGHGGKSGNAVVWDVKTGHRVTEVGAEFDQVMSADISSNQRMIVIGSPSKKVKCYNASTGEEMWVVKKHTEWILNVAFSPDGVLVASADRNGGIIISEAATGGEFYVLDGHKSACTGLSWRGDSNVLASCAEDGKVAVWEMENGKLMKNWDAHGGGALSVAFTADGNLVSSGRDGMIRLWDINGKKLSESKAQGDIVTRVAALSDGKTVASGGWQGIVKIWKADKFEELGELSSNPSPIAQRIADTERIASTCQAELPKAESELKVAAETVKTKEARAAELKGKLAQEKDSVKKAEAEIAAMPARTDALKLSVAEWQAKRRAQELVIKGHEEKVSKVKKLESKVAELETEHHTLVAEAERSSAPEQAEKRAEAEVKAAKAKEQCDARRARLEKLKADVATAPQPLAEFDKQIKSGMDQIAELQKAKPGKEKKLAEWKKISDALPAQIENAEKEAKEAKTGLAEKQAKLDALHVRLAWAQKYPAFLRAAQFNVGVLAEKEKLEKLENEVKSLQEGLKDAETGRVAAAERIESAKKAMADATGRLPAIEEVLARVKGELPAVEKIVEPGLVEEGQALPLVKAQKKIIEDQETALKSLDKEKADRVAAAQKAVEEINKQTAALQKQQGEIGAKADKPLKDWQQKKAALNKAEAEWSGAKEKQTAAAKLVQQREAELKAGVNGQALEGEALESANRTLAETLASAKQANEAAAAAEKSFETAKTAVGAADKIAAPLREQQKNIAAQIEKQKETLVAKQAEPAQADKDFASKSQPIQAAIAAAKATMEPLEKKLGEIRSKLDVDRKTVEAKRAEVAKAQGEVDGAKKAQVDGKRTVESSTKEISDRVKAMAEGKLELAKLEPQIAPQRKSVKRINDQYLAMLPK
ncbi:MAG TPA: c-type cytochrome domain-containing protein [Verrucomicrobiaceae bacterium]